MNSNDSGTGNEGAADHLVSEHDTATATSTASGGGGGGLDADTASISGGTLRWADAAREEPSEEQRRTFMTKRVSWVDGISEAKSAHIAISIPRHKCLKVCTLLLDND
jgi:hypothetical protein